MDGIERCIDDEIPFEIPQTWSWARLGHISTYAQTKRKMNAASVDHETWILDLEDIEKGGKLICKVLAAERKAIGEKTVFNKGDVLYSKLRPYLLKILVADGDGICTPEIVPFKMYSGILNDFVSIYLKSPYVDNLINTITYGVKMPRVSTDTMVNLLVPLPPYEEQRRIVEAFQQLIPVISKV